MIAAFAKQAVWANSAGVPDSASVQEVIFWQGRTIQMMYHIIGEAMRRNNITDAHPKDYLAFFCLGEVTPCGDVIMSWQAAITLVSAAIVPQGFTARS